MFLLRCGLYARANIDKFSKNGDNHAYETRNRESLRVPLHKSVSYEKSPEYLCLSVYNRIPSHIKNSNSYSNFKRCLRDYLADKCYYSIEEFLFDC